MGATRDNFTLSDYTALMGTDNGNDAATLAQLAGELAEHIAAFEVGGAGALDELDLPTEAERSHALHDAVTVLDQMTARIYVFRARLVDAQVTRHHEAMRATDELLARSRADRAAAGTAPTGKRPG